MYTKGSCRCQSSNCMKICDGKNHKRLFRAFGCDDYLGMYLPIIVSVRRVGFATCISKLSRLCGLGSFFKICLTSSSRPASFCSAWKWEREKWTKHEAKRKTNLEYAFDLPCLVRSKPGWHGDQAQSISHWPATLSIN